MWLASEVILLILEVRLGIYVEGGEPFFGSQSIVHPDYPCSFHRCS